MLRLNTISLLNHKTTSFFTEWLFINVIRSPNHKTTLILTWKLCISVIGLLDHKNNFVSILKATICNNVSWVHWKHHFKTSSYFSRIHWFCPNIAMLNSFACPHIQSNSYNNNSIYQFSKLIHITYHSKSLK